MRTARFKQEKDHDPKPYQYEPLCDGETRFITVMPASHDDDDIRISIVRRNAQEMEARYIALSYTWTEDAKEDDKGPFRIWVGSSYLMIMKNLYALLRRLRVASVRGKGLWWIDALSINQEDYLEREKQVRLMPNLYPQAHLVIAWLGEEDESTELAFRFFDQWARAKLLKDQSAKQTMIKLAADELSMRGPAPTMNAVQALFRRRWFWRTWTFPEVALCADNLCCWLCGHQYMFIYTFLLGYSEFLDCFGYDAIKFIGPDWNMILVFMSHLTVSKELARFSTLYHAISWRSCTVPRDILYATICMLKNPSQYPSPDYTQYSDQQVAVAVTRATIRQEKSLDVLHATQCIQASDEQPSSWPSWAVRIHIIGEPSHWIDPPGRTWLLQHTTYQYKAARGWSAQLLDETEPAHSAILSLRGIIIDTVELTIPIRRVRDWLQEHALEYGTAVQACEAYAKSYALRQHPACLEESIGVSLARTLQLDKGSGDSELMISDDQQDDASARVTANVIWPTPTRRWMQKIDRILRPARHKIIPKARRPFAVPDHTPTLQRRHNQAILGETTKFLTIMNDERDLFISRQGRIGSASCKLAIADDIAILPGSSMPVILRKHGELEENRIFMGNAYVHGVMYGERFCADELIDIRLV